MIEIPLEPSDPNYDEAVRRAQKATPPEDRHDAEKFLKRLDDTLKGIKKVLEEDKHGKQSTGHSGREKRNRILRRR